MLDIFYGNVLGSPVPGMPGSQLSPVPIMRMYGVTMEGNSVCCHVHGFSPYFFVSAPSKFTDSDCHPFKVRMFSCCLVRSRRLGGPWNWSEHFEEWKMPHIV